MSKLKAKTPELVSPGKTKALIFGPPGVGKTWFSLSFPKPYYFDTEGGADLKHYQERLKAVGGAYLGPGDGTLSFDFLFEQMLALMQEKHDYRTLIIDSITKIFQTSVSDEAARLGDKDAFGASKKPAIAHMRRLVALAARLDMNVLMIAHETTEWGKAANGQREEIGKMADTWDKLSYELHLALRAQKRGNSRVAIVTKSRLTGFGEGDTFPLEYGEFSKRYGKDFIEAESKPVVLATAEQAAEISRLLQVVKIPAEELENILKKAGAENIGELNTDQAAKTITWLHQKLQPTK